MRRPIFDGHVDLVYGLMRHHPQVPFHRVASGPVTLSDMNRAGVKVIVSALYCPDEYNGPGTSAGHLRRLFQYADEFLTGLQHVGTAADLAACLDAATGTGVIELLENADALVDGAVSLSELKDRGIWMVGLTHAGVNRIGQGNGVGHPEGLTAAGKNLVKALDKNGFGIDIAHLADPCFYDLLDIYNGPLISSHTGFRQFCPRSRNLDREHLEAVFNRQGVVGVTVNPEMLALDGQVNVEDVFRQIDWLVQGYGPQGVGLGTDFYGFDLETLGLPDLAGLRGLEEMFDRHGYDEDSISRIMGGNWAAFYAGLPDSREARTPSK
ncbi:MAG: membrane dipeptidase [Deltaproteobacteria bacterium]|nr:membrane dipeptidase [Deltaproteobacteria bacterium]